jgi:hypothetical protein
MTVLGRMIRDTGWKALDCSCGHRHSAVPERMLLLPKLFEVQTFYKATYVSGDAEGEWKNEAKMGRE